MDARRTVLLAGALGVAISAVILLAAGRGDLDETASGDGLIYRYVAAHLSTPPADVHPVVVERGAALRYGRIGLPAAIWLVSAGRPSLMPAAQALLIALSGGLAAAAAARLLRARAPVAGLSMFVVPAVPLAISGGFADVVALALALWACAEALDDRWGVTAALMAGALLVRENAVFVLAGLGVYAVARAGARLRVNRRALVALALAPVPLAIWYGVVWARFGTIPILDPYLREHTTTVGPPGVAFARSLLDGHSIGSVVLALAHAALAAGLIVLARRSSIALIGAISGAQVLVAGPFAWRFIGEGVRTNIFLQAFFVLAVLSVLQARRHEPEPLARTAG